MSVKFLSLAEAHALAIDLHGRDLDGFRPLDRGDNTFKYDSDSGRKNATARAIVDQFEWPVLICVTDTFVWPSSGNPDLTNLVWRGLGETESIYDRPAIVVHQPRADAAIAVVSLIMLCIWDAIVIESSSRAWLFSNDEFVDVVNGSDEGNLQIRSIFQTSEAAEPEPKKNLFGWPLRARRSDP